MLFRKLGGELRERNQYIVWSTLWRIRIASPNRQTPRTGLMPARSRCVIRTSPMSSETLWPSAGGSSAEKSLGELDGTEHRPKYGEKRFEFK